MIEHSKFDRNKWLGGSDCAAVLGVSPYDTPVEMWQKKTGRASNEAIDPAQQKRFDRGHRLEPVIREMTIDKLQSMGLRVELLACNQRYADPEHPFLSCEIDFELRLWGTVEIDGNDVVFAGESINADAKSVTGFARKKWGEVDSSDVPIEYAAQFQMGLMITDRATCLVAALRSFDDVDIFWCLRDEETIKAMRLKLVSFWLDHVLADVPPDPYTFDDICSLFSSDNGLSIEATAEIAEKVADLDKIRKQVTEWEKAEEALKMEIADFIRPNAALTVDGRVIATLKGQNYTRLDLEAFREAHPDIAKEYTRTKTIRVLRVKKGN